MVKKSLGELKAFVKDAKAKEYSDAKISKALLKQGVDPKTVSAVLPGSLNKVTSFIKHSRTRGYKDEQIKQALRSAGFTEKEIAAAFVKTANKSKILKVALLSLLALALLIAAVFAVNYLIEEEDVDRGTRDVEPVVDDTDPLPEPEPEPEDDTDSGTGGGAEPQCGDGVCYIGEEACVIDCGGCTSDDECQAWDADLVCGDDGWCTDAPSGGSGGDDPGATTTSGCTEDNECNTGEVCVDAVCVLEGGIDLIITEVGAERLEVEGVSLQDLDICVQNVGDESFTGDFEMHIVSYDEAEQLNVYDDLSFTVSGVSLDVAADCVDVSSFFQDVEVPEGEEIYLGLTIDSSNLVEELDETNNDYAITLNIEAEPECVTADDCNEGYYCDVTDQVCVLSDGICVDQLPACADGVDNDADGLVDLDDPSCANDWTGKAESVSCSDDSDCGGYECDLAAGVCEEFCGVDESGNALGCADTHGCFADNDFYFDYLQGIYPVYSQCFPYTETSCSETDSGFDLITGGETTQALAQDTDNVLFNLGDVCIPQEEAPEYLCETDGCDALAEMYCGAADGGDILIATTGVTCSTYFGSGSVCEYDENDLAYCSHTTCSDDSDCPGDQQCEEGVCVENTVDLYVDTAGGNVTFNKTKLMEFDLCLGNDGLVELDGDVDVLVTLLGSDGNPYDDTVVQGTGVYIENDGSCLDIGSNFGGLNIDPLSYLVTVQLIVDPDLLIDELSKDNNEYEFVLTPPSELVCAEVLPECADGVDNDGDGYVDYADDPDCLTWEQNSEESASSGGSSSGGSCSVDADCDASIFEICVSGTCQIAECADGLDNDGDFDVDILGGWSETVDGDTTYYSCIQEGYTDKDLCNLDHGGSLLDADCDDGFDNSEASSSGSGSGSNTAPIINDVIGIFEVTIPGTVTVIVDAEDADGDALTYTFDSSFMSSGTANTIDELLTWDVNPGDEGTYVLDIYVDDGIDTVSTSVDIVVNPMSELGSADGDSGDAFSGINDLDGDFTIPGGTGSTSGGTTTGSGSDSGSILDTDGGTTFGYPDVYDETNCSDGIDNDGDGGYDAYGAYDADGDGIAETTCYDLTCGGEVRVEDADEHCETKSDPSEEECQEDADCEALYDDTYSCNEVKTCQRLVSSAEIPSSYSYLAPAEDIVERSVLLNWIRGLFS